MAVVKHIMAAPAKMIDLIGIFLPYFSITPFCRLG
jgi:hypothetical protein